MQLAGHVSAWASRARGLGPGVLACGVVGAAAAFLSEHYGAPVMLFALLLGIASVVQNQRLQATRGIDASSLL